MAKVAERVQVIASIVQAVAIILGVAFSVNELVLKDREATRQFVELTLGQIDRGQSEPVVSARRRLYELRNEAYAVPVSGPGQATLADAEMRSRVIAEFDDQTRALSHFYNILARCYEARVCDQRIVLAVTCDDVTRDVDAIGELVSRVGDKLLTPKFFAGLSLLDRECRARSAAMPAQDIDPPWKPKLPPATD